MKIILSRKGFDSGYGGCASPIMPNGEMISMPIPSTTNTRGEVLKYKDLRVEGKKTYFDILKEINGDMLKVEPEGKFKLEDLYCHLDPDVREHTKDRKKGWRGLFGQNGKAQTHLQNQKVQKGDVFLFFGWFRQTEEVNGKLRYKRGDKGFHAIHGYFQVGEIHKINDLEKKDWMREHPHVLRGQNASDLDHIYIANEKLSYDENYKGYGSFSYNPKLKLTKDGYTKSRWNLPDIFKDVNISYHKEASWKEQYFQSAAKGQEFVIEANEDIENWMLDIIKK